MKMEDVRRLLQTIRSYGGFADTLLVGPADEVQARSIAVQLGLVLQVDAQVPAGSHLLIWKNTSSSTRGR